MKKNFRSISIFLFTLIFSTALAYLFGQFYKNIFHPQFFYSFFVPIFWYDFFIGLPLSYIFFLFLLFTAFGGKKKYWWIGIGAIPAVAFELYFDAPHLYFPILLGLAGWVIGAGLQKLPWVKRLAL